MSRAVLLTATPARVQASMQNESTAHELQEKPMSVSGEAMSTDPTPVPPTRYVPPAGRMDRWSGDVVRWLTAHGISVLGSRVLVVKGRASGQPRRVPVNLLELDGERY